MITTSIIGHNVENYLERALICAAQIGDIVFMNHNSTDGTREIAEKYTNKIIDYKAPTMDLAWARNVMAWEAKTDLIFALDADEFFNYDAMREYLKRNGAKFTNAMGALPLCESYAPGYCEPYWLDDAKPRIYNRRYGLWTEALHAKLIGKCNDNFVVVPIYLWHRAFKYGLESWWNKIDYYNRRMNRTAPYFSERSYWEAEYQRIYGAQEPVPSQEEAAFVKSFFEAHPWQTEDVVGG